MRVHTQRWIFAAGMTLVSAALGACGTGTASDTGGDTGGRMETGGRSTDGGTSAGGTGGSSSTKTGGSSGTSTGGDRGSSTGGKNATGGSSGSATGGSSSTGGATGGSAVSTGGSPTGGGTGGGSTSTGGGSGNNPDGGADAGTPPSGGGSGLPCEVTSLLTKCVSCHGATPAGGAPSSLVTYADLMAPAKSDPSRSEAAVALARMNNTASPMPPAGSPKPTAAEIAAMQTWVSAGMPKTTCGTGGGADGGTSGDAGTGPTTPDPLNSAAKCTSNRTWSGGNQESPNMNPGMACINCHSRGEGPRFAIAGTLYPTGHEPDLCNGSSGNTTGARVVITGADGKVTTLTPNDVGNFYTNTAVAKPYTVKVTYMGRTRAMGAAPSSGDCNSCHTQTGTMSAPGRITLP